MKSSRMFSVLIIILVISSCSLPVKTEYQSYYKNRPDTNTDLSDASESKIVEIWTPEDIVSSELDYFNQRYSDYEFKVRVIDEVDLIDTYYEALLTNNEPDVMLTFASDVGVFSGLDKFENLNEKPYYDKEFFEKRPDNLLDNYLNDQDEMYGFPILIHPYVTLYRHDIFEQFGFPTVPDELAEYIADVDNWLEIVKILNDNGLYGYESVQASLDWGLNSSYPFDQDYQYIYQEKPFSDLLTALTLAEEMELNIYQTIWLEDGLNNLKDDKFVMFQGPSYMNDVLYEWLPEQAGKWRNTKLPFGMNGIEKNTSLIAMIAKSSSNKEVAWDLLKSIAENMFYNYSYNQNHVLLDQDNINEFHLSLLAEPHIGKPSMLDRTADLLWENNVYRVNQGQRLTDKFLQQTHSQVIEQVLNNRRVLIDN